MKKTLFLLTCLSSLVIAGEVKENKLETKLKYERLIGPGLYNYFGSETKLDIKLPLDFELNLMLDLNYNTIESLNKNDSFAKLTKKFDKYGNLILEINAEKSIKLAYNNKYNFNKNSKVYGGLELKKIIKTPDAKNRLTNIANLSLGLEHKKDDSFGKYLVLSELLYGLHYDKIIEENLKLNPIPEFNLSSMMPMPMPMPMPITPSMVTNQETKKVLSNLIGLNLKGELEFKEVPVSLKGQGKIDLILNNINDFKKKEEIAVKTKLVTSVDYTYKKDKFVIRPEFKLEDKLTYIQSKNTEEIPKKLSKDEEEKIKKQMSMSMNDLGMGMDKIIGVYDLEQMTYKVSETKNELKLIPSVYGEYELKDNLKLFSKVGFVSNFEFINKKDKAKEEYYKILKEHNVLKAQENGKNDNMGPDFSFGSINLNNGNNEKKFKHSTSNFVFELGLKYSW